MPSLGVPDAEAARPAAVLRAAALGAVTCFLLVGPGCGASTPLRSASVPFYDPDSEFLWVAKQCETDKVTTHNYDVTYSAFLHDKRDSELKMLEIGLGCDMNYGPGHSVCLWQHYLPRADVWFAEYDGACVEQFYADKPEERAKVLVGDQADWRTLAGWVDSAGDGFDLIIDDGGHTNIQQFNSFYALFYNALRPGGLYVIEDLQVSYGRLEPVPVHANAYPTAKLLAHWADLLASAELQHLLGTKTGVSKEESMRQLAARRAQGLSGMVGAHDMHSHLSRLVQGASEFPQLSGSPSIESLAISPAPPPWLKSIHCYGEVCVLQKCLEHDVRCMGRL